MIYIKLIWKQDHFIQKFISKVRKICFVASMKFLQFIFKQKKQQQKNKQKIAKKQKQKEIEKKNTLVLHASTKYKRIHEM